MPSALVVEFSSYYAGNRPAQPAISDNYDRPIEESVKYCTNPGSCLSDILTFDRQKRLNAQSEN